MQRPEITRTTGPVKLARLAIARERLGRVHGPTLPQPPPIGGESTCLWLPWAGERWHFPMFHPIDIHESVREIFLEAQAPLMDRAWAWAARRAEELRASARERARPHQAKRAKKSRERQLARPRWGWSAELGWFVK